ncbi:hypothetical protein NJF44_01100 [Pseudomonas guariconensis]|uniref:hypothetical protein n=1 Tax=Pseudomonas TaxID=286 RepID=UPI002097F9FD|nr:MULTISPECIES: hypothetical protein [Pseudomonas]MCO7513760.1 hypothetical protein [Pseudomonas putida]MCO7603839.1 hypothetical protein [Pseudomonas guariconensis]
MKYRVLFWCGLTAASIAFLGGVISGVWSATASISCRISQAEEHNPPPAGDQFDEGPVLVRLPGASTNHIRYIF